MKETDCFIRPASEADTDALYEICLKTADSGADASALYSDARLPGFIWAAPYLKFAPDFAFVLVQDDLPVGYVIGTPDTPEFDRQLRAHWWPYVRQEIAGLEPSREKDADAIDRIAHPRTGSSWLEQRFPAHVHINVLPPAQGSGWGRRMLDIQLNALRNAGVKGVHLGVDPRNEGAKGFYRHLRFSEIERDGSLAFTMRL